MFAAVCVLLAALGHVMMSGSHVPAWALSAGAAVTGAVGWCLAGRERGLPLIVTVVVAAQTVLHSAFSLAQSPAPGQASGTMALMNRGSLPPMGSTDMGSTPMGSTPMGSTPMGSTPMGSMDMGSMDVGFMGSMPMDSMDFGHMGMGHMGMGHMGVGHMGVSPTAHMGHSAFDTSSFGMLGAHLLAALLCGLWLAHGEKAAFRILRAVAGWLAAPLRLLLALPVPQDRPRFRVRRGRSDRAPRLLLLVHTITHRGPPRGTAVV